MAQVRHLGHVRLLVLAFHLPAGNMWLESFPKVDRTHDGVDNGGNDQEYGDDSKRGKRLSSWKERVIVTFLVHAYQFEEEVC